ncbi:MAG: 1-acyl-sn-glycerol-3-phosphate acyltransferase [Oscillospiraceae bacterium]|jgi:1-acyl-sn-glycerol-3-phosphate acyltransferase|nr:1-acyl-sn-glycerol-3-phosphate acyltransferase [Oscillospiraceae bacterium]
MEKRRFWYKVYHAAVSAFAHLFYRFKVTGLERLPDGACVICSNHSSNWDVVFLTVAIGRTTPLIFTPKRSMLRVPILGRMMTLIGVVWIDRDNPSDIAPLRSLLRYLGEGEKVVMFPEGRRMKAGESESAKTGAIMLASRSAAPLVPVHIPARKRAFSRITISIGEPFTIAVHGSAERRARAEELMVRIRELEPV